jgi:predicted HicB family RNase H-like nuclease
MTANTTLEYRGYIALIELDDDEDCFHGRVMNTRDTINFYGRTPGELRAEFAKSVDEYLVFCAEQGMKPEKPYSGNFTVRLTPEIHRALAVKAARQHKSLSKLVQERLEGAAREPEGALA